MDDLELLSDDHSLLRSQVIHAMALLKSLLEGGIESATLYSEIVGQMDLLHAQLVEHFEFEEEIAFPKLEERFPMFMPQLQTFLGQHDQILEALEELRLALKLNFSQLEHGSALSKAAFFETVFERHATSETQLFDELAKQIAGQANT